MRRIVVLFVGLFLCVSAFCQNSSGREFISRIFVGSNGATVPYKILYPDNFNPASTYPVLLFLHGAGERGTDNQAQLTHGGDLLRTDSSLLNMIVVVPQCPEEDYWARVVVPETAEGNLNRKFPLNAPEAPTTAAVKELLDNLISLGFADPEKIYGTGLSMGAMGILDMVMRYPDFFAAVEPICGGVNIDRCLSYKGRTAFRFFHGLNDSVVLPKFSIEADQALRSVGVNSTIVLYPDVTHGSWKNAFVEPDYFSWMFQF